MSKCELHVGCVKQREKGKKTSWKKPVRRVVAFNDTCSKKKTLNKEMRFLEMAFFDSLGKI